jgi:hypothetical protein
VNIEIINQDAIYPYIVQRHNWRVVLSRDGAIWLFFFGVIPRHPIKIRKGEEIPSSIPRYVREMVEKAIRIRGY